MTQVNVRREGSVAIVDLAAPTTGNALSAALVGELRAAVVALPGTGARALVLAGSGRHFCTGAHLGELEQLARAPLAERLGDAERLAALYAAILRCPLPTVAAVHGAAYGGGAGLAAACDLVFAEPGASFQFSEVRLGFVPALISVFLPRRLPVARLAQLFIAPAPLSAGEALTIGLVDEVVEDALSVAITRAAQICRSAAPSAVAATKALLLAHACPNLDADLARAARVNAEQRAHPECQRGVAAYLRDRAFPSWGEEP
jgi:methylglutaconyl-CoA hydratase